MPATSPKNTELIAKLEVALAEATDQKAHIEELSHTSGGSINQAALARLADGRQFFVKSNVAPPPQFFDCEVEGLEVLAKAGVLRVPKVVTLRPAGDDHPAFLILEAITGPTPGEGFHETFGRRLAKLHRVTAAERFGFDRDNYIGATPQPNRWTDDWCEFWRRHRLGFQLDLARRSGRSDPTLDQLGEKLLDRLDDLIGEPADPPSLLHGDLWAGNFLVDESGEPVLIDPAVYHGRREADLAMTQLFGGFDASFYGAYEEAWPLEPDYEERLEIYKLYHLLNHLNLFGGSYHASCVDILRRFA